MAKTKIVATIGPASDDKKKIERLIKAGVDVFRLNFKHSSLRWHSTRMKRIREVAKKLSLAIGLMIDLRGPEGRVEKPNTLFADDLKALLLGKKYEADFVALSFVRGEKDILHLKRVLAKEGLSSLVIAKIEHPRAIENFEKILLKADGIMVARGDLGIELPIEEVPFWQKYIIDRCLKIGKPVITATEMLLSMTKNPLPTRAEVSDIANSVYDFSDALMLSEETATGKYPVEAVEMMRKTCEFIEGKLEPKGIELPAGDQTSAMTLAAFNLVRESKLPQAFRAFVVLTETGKTARLLSRLRPKLSILAVTDSQITQKQLSLSWGVEAFYFDYPQAKIAPSIRPILAFLKKKGKLAKGDKVVMIYGDDWGTPGRTNLVRIQEV